MINPNTDFSVLRLDVLENLSPAFNRNGDTIDRISELDLHVTIGESFILDYECHSS